jgi:HPt (histidine-containing phosphotransfer) domain-containing protein
MELSETGGAEPRSTETTMLEATSRAVPSAARAPEQPTDLSTPSLEPAVDTEPAREPGAFDELVREIGQDGACEVRSVFWTETSARLRLFRELAFEPHRTRIERESHSLKSAARTFGYRRLASLALRLERSATALDEAAYRELLQQMDAAYVAALEQEPRG